jgi:hypothetical protein
MSGKKMIAHQAWIAAITKAQENGAALTEEQEKDLLSLFDDWWEKAGSQLDKLDRILGG